MVMVNKKFINNFKKFLKKHIYLAPILMLFISFLSIFTNYTFIDTNYIVLANTGGSSILSNIPLILYFTFNKSYCIFTRLSPIGLIILNITDIIGNYVSQSFYNFWYTVITFFIVIGLALFLEITKRLNK